MTGPGFGHRLPLGVAILAVLIGLFGVFYLLIGVLVVLVVAVGSGLIPHLLGTGLLAGALLIVLGVVLLVVAAGLWHLELWALVLSILVVGALWLSDVVSGSWLSLRAIIALLLLVYLVAVHREFT